MCNFDRILYMRKTKIVATLGPATEKEETIVQLLKAGVNLFRFNMKYSPNSWHNDKIAKIRKNAVKLKINVGIIIDIPRNDFLIEIKDFDYIALSYLKSAKEVDELRKRVERRGINTKIIAKIENRQAMTDLSNIIRAADGLMVARGDLGRETPIEELAFLQKQIVDAARIAGKPVIVATEMLYSMTHHDKPTRAEATDVANAVFDGTDAVMLSEETAMGEFPVEAVKVMAKITSFCETTGELRSVDMRAKTLIDALTESAARMTSDRLDKPIKAVVTFTRGGTTTKMMARYRLAVPIIAISNDEKVLNQLCLSYSVIPFLKKFDDNQYKTEDPVFESLIQKGLLKSKDTIVVVHGDAWFGQGPANRLSIRTL
jgi:pyruvate kinase